MRIQKNQRGASLELWTRRGSWFWQLSNPANGYGIVGAAPSVEEAARDAGATLEEVEPNLGTVPALLESALTWTRVLEELRRVALAV